MKSIPLTSKSKNLRTKKLKKEKKIQRKENNYKKKKA